MPLNWPKLQIVLSHWKKKMFIGLILLILLATGFLTIQRMTSHDCLWSFGYGSNMDVKALEAKKHVKVLGNYENISNCWVIMKHLKIRPKSKLWVINYLHCEKYFQSLIEHISYIWNEPKQLDNFLCYKD